MNQKKRQAIFERLSLAIPDPVTELNYSSPFELLIAVVLSAQATDKGVNKVTFNLFKAANSPQTILTLGLDGLKNYVKTIGLYNTKSENIIKLCQQLLDKHKGLVPQNRDDLEALPGVGRKTASVILNTAFGYPTIAVDTHIFRVSNRTGLAAGKNVLEVERGLEKWVPKQYKKDAHHLLILHGRYTCMARKPKCQMCVINNLCDFKEKTLAF